MTSFQCDPYAPITNASLFGFSRAHPIRAPRLNRCRVSPFRSYPYGSDSPKPARRCQGGPDPGSADRMTLRGAVVRAQQVRSGKRATTVLRFSGVTRPAERAVACRAGCHRSMCAAMNFANHSPPRRPSVLTVSDGGRTATIMVGPLRSPAHLEVVHRERFYHVPVTAIRAARTAVGFIAFYEGASRFPGGRVSSGSTRRCSASRRCRAETCRA